MAFVEGFSLKKAVFPFSRGKKGVESRGSLISVPLAFRDFLRSRKSAPMVGNAQEVE